MNPIRVKLEELKTKTIPIGREGENNYTVVSIDCSSVFKKHPAAVTTMRVKPPKGLIYPVTVTQDGTDIIWTVKDSDLACKGDGQFQLTFTEDTVICKSVIGRTLILKSLKTEGPAPDPIQDWLEEAEEALEELEAAEVHQPTIGEDGYWYTWDQEAGEYQKTETKAQGEDGQPGQDGHTPEKGVDYWTAADKAEMESDVAGAIIDDTSTALDKVWSASKSGELLSEIQVLEPSAAAGDVGKVPKVKTVADGKVTEYEFGSLPTVPSIATSEQIKAGTDNEHPVAPILQHEAAFFALAKMAGADMAALSSVTVGQYPDAQKVAIQKMLGIYESPWELIREDTVTNATEADVTIDVDGDGAAFELTDLILRVQLPKNTNVSIGNYGIVRVYSGVNDYCSGELSVKSLDTSNNYIYNAFLKITQTDGMLEINFSKYSTTGYASYVYRQGSDPFMLTKKTFTKAVINAVTGTMKYTLYGKRKWN